MGLFHVGNTSFTHRDPHSPDYTPYIYEWVHLPTEKSGTRTVWVLNGGSIRRLMEHWNAARPDLWCFILLGMAVNPRRAARKRRRTRRS